MANMTLLTVALFNPAGAAVDMLGYVYNLAVVSLGNIIGGVVFMALPYYAIARKKPATDKIKRPIKSKSLGHPADARWPKLHL